MRTNSDEAIVFDATFGSEIGAAAVDSIDRLACTLLVLLPRSLRRTCSPLRRPKPEAQRSTLNALVATSIKCSSPPTRIVVACCALSAQTESNHETGDDTLSSSACSGWGPRWLRGTPHSAKYLGTYLSTRKYARYRAAGAISYDTASAEGARARERAAPSAMSRRHNLEAPVAWRECEAVSGKVSDRGSLIPVLSLPRTIPTGCNDGTHYVILPCQAKEENVEQQHKWQQTRGADRRGEGGSPEEDSKMRDMCPLDEITHEEIREDFLQSMMVEFMGFLSTTAIPFNCDDELMPRNRPAEGESVRVVIASTLSKYVGRIIRCIWRLFPSHPDFAELDINKQTDVPDWWKRVRPGFEKTIDDFHRHAVRPLFLKNRYNPRAGQPIAEPIADFVSEIDLHSICKGLMKKARVNFGQGEIGPLQQRAWLVWLYHCLDRPSEIKFIDIRSWMHIPALGTVNAPTTDKKTKKKYSCGLVPDKHDFFCDILHVTAALFAVEEGAYRTAAQKSTESFLFQPFHGKSDNNVAKQITAVIRENLPAGTPTRIRKIMKTFAVN
ncbi:hypothetical protein THAOC_05188 [Thalassiosira oceanica]|uniref:Uncharacterized protein n=1 Tax=Thalassiosira oceanica TaxID=159749 RepID=K0THR4_THAOC|nr:hypothetical protein THAOC_05188 [Thalassiosira oceanica]|eukprot:EJK73201.1 hypothetical protein THAOC_05188 [Thalassiosira oceanica]